MRGDDANRGSMFSSIDLEKRVSPHHPLLIVVLQAAIKRGYQVSESVSGQLR